MTDQADERLKLRDRYEDASWFHCYVRQLHWAITADAVAEKKIRLRIEKLWNDRQDCTSSTASAKHRVVGERGAAAEGATEAVELEMPPAGVGSDFGHNVRPDIRRIGGRGIEPGSAGVVEGGR